MARRSTECSQTHDFDEIRRVLAPLALQHDQARQTLREQRKRLDSLDRKILAIQEAIDVAQTVAQTMLTQVHQRISLIVSQCLSDVFDKPCKFEIIWDKKRGKTVGRMVFKQDSHEVDPLSGDGGSAVEVASFAIRVADLIGSPAERRRFLILDEPFLALSERMKKRVKQLLITLSDKLNIQMLIITHDATFEIGKVVRI